LELLETEYWCGEYSEPLCWSAILYHSALRPFSTYAIGGTLLEQTAVVEWPKFVEPAVRYPGQTFPMVAPRCMSISSHQINSSAFESTGARGTIAPIVATQQCLATSPDVSLETIFAHGILAISAVNTVFEQANMISRITLSPPHRKELE